MAPQPTRSSTRRLVLVGMGPRGTSLLERLVSNALAEPGGQVDVHLVDPYPPGGGRVWRSAQSPLLRLNTTAEDLTAFVDDSVALDGPVTSGPTLHEWCQAQGVHLDDPDLSAEAAMLGPLDFPSRRLGNAYFGWALDRTRSRAPDSMRLISHAQRAVDIDTPADGNVETVVLEDGERIAADAVVLLNSHVDVRPAPPFAALDRFAAEHELTYLPPAYGGDVDLSAIRAGEDVLVRGFGLGFIDLMILLTEGRGGRFVPASTGLRYLPSGAEPRLLVGSRRGVPYHAKPMYHLQAPRPAATRFCTPTAIQELLRRGTTIDFWHDLWPLIAQEVTWGYYLELIYGHPGRIAVSATEFARRLAELDRGSLEDEQWVADVVPDPEDRFDLLALDRPLHEQRAADRTALSTLIRGYIRADLDRRQNVHNSADLGAFHALLAVLPVLGPALGSPRMDPGSLLHDFYGWFLGFFSFYASGPPPDRLEQLLALEQAGVLAFLGAGLEIDADPERELFVARSTTIDQQFTTRSMIDATLPAFDLHRTTDPILSALAARGEAVSHVLVNAGSRPLDTGQLRVDGSHRLVKADGSSSPGRFALGMHTMIKSPAFARPGSSSAMHRHNDQVARELLASSTTKAETGEQSGDVSSAADGLATGRADAA